LSYHFKGFPAIASVAKPLLGKMISIKQSLMYIPALGKAVAASYSNYKAIVVLDKKRLFQGEQVTGKSCVRAL
jgi:hypothetical protein